MGWDTDKCSRCGGSGEFWCPDTEEYAEPREETPCPDCGGDGRPPKRTRRIMVPEP